LTLRELHGLVCHLLLAAEQLGRLLLAPYGSLFGPSRVRARGLEVRV
jgi:hypothetical protein